MYQVATHPLELYYFYLIHQTQVGGFDLLRILGNRLHGSISQLAMALLHVALL